MRKVLLLLAISLFFASCSKDDDPKSPYTAKQQEAFKMFQGVFKETNYTFYNIDKITFSTHYNEPKKFSSEGQKEAHGELIYNEYNTLEGKAEDVTYYYYLSADATNLRLYHKGGSSDEQLYDKYTLSIKSQNEFWLKHEMLSMPYIFVRQ